jgi:hypothetical protein
MGFALDVISQWHKNYRFVNGFLAKMEATISFSPLENWGREGYDPSKPVSLHPARHRGGGDQTSSVPSYRPERLIGGHLITAATACSAQASREPCRTFPQGGSPTCQRKPLYPTNRTRYTGVV